MRLLTRTLLGVALACLPLQSAISQDDSLEARRRRQSTAAETAGLAEPFRGITTNGVVRTGLFPLRSTGVSTAPVVSAAKAFLATLQPWQRTKAVFPVDDPEWRKWMNQHFYIRQGVGFNEMTEPQRAAAFALVGSALSAKGLKLTQDIMKLNHTLGELANNNFREYGEWLYYVTVMGDPHGTEPWGWQLEGHHLIVNYFVMGDQVVMTPLFVGSEPVIATSGKYKGTSILQDEQEAGLAMITALDATQQKAAIIEVSKTGNNNMTEAFRDNVVLNYVGAPVRTFTAAQKKSMLALIGLFVFNMKEDQGRVRMSEVEAHIDSTHFAWVGGTGPKDVFYFRIQSPVILIEFDHQRPAGLRNLYPANVPFREHVHVVVRTPNGGDYGKDLLRQHYEQHRHPH
ncbi:MAG: DUF3500 domain-containing protein [Cytophagaceae bacterium]|nr:DUF3500 domain-containing protein [Gemmatimonadaceae bacterium]